MNDRWIDKADDDATVRLLRLAGPRSAVPADRAARVRAVVQVEWETITRRRTVGRRIMFGSAFLTAAAAAAVVLMIGQLTPSERRASPSGEPVAVVEQIDGTPQRVSYTADRPASAPLSTKEAVRAGEWMETGDGARLALRFSNGTSVRLDVGSRVRPLSSTAIELSAGAVYVDTGGESGRFEVRTPMATARDVGTQFEVRLLDRSLRLRVRTGLVELKDQARSVSGRGGTEITLSSTGAVSRPIATYGSEWNWTTHVSPALEMEGMSLSDFLEAVAREQGWAVHYADPAVAGEAARIILHGSADGLAPHEAVAVAVGASGLQHRLDGGELVVRAPDARERN